MKSKDNNNLQLAFNQVQAVPVTCDRGSDTAFVLPTRLFRPTPPRGGQPTPADAPAAAACADPFSNEVISRAGHIPVVDHSKRKLRQARLRILPGGMVVRQFQGCSIVPPRSSVRGVIDGFSLDSRRRLRKKLMSVDFASTDLLWVTLTYHKSWGASFKDWKADFENYIKRMLKTWPEYQGLMWRLEFQERGAPHFHFLISFPKGKRPAAASFQMWSSHSWADVIGGPEDQDLLIYGSKVIEVCNSRELGKLLGYLVKEMGKVTQGIGDRNGTGRMWGVRGSLPMIAIADVQFKSEADFAEFCRRVNVAGRGVSAFWEKISPAWSGFCLLGDGLDMISLLDGIDVEFLPCDNRELVSVW